MKSLQELHWDAIRSLKQRLAEARNNATLTTDREAFMEGVYVRLGKENPRPTREMQLISRLENELRELQKLTPQEWLAKVRSGCSR